MKKGFPTVYKAVFSLLIVSAVAAASAGCSLNINLNTESGVSSQSSAESSESSTEASQESEESTEPDNSEVPVVTGTEGSQESEQSDEMTESQAAEVSVDGYQFDDEQIVKDYHTAQEFTKNEEFNALFKSNAIDKEYGAALEEATTILSMRQSAISAANKWKDKIDPVYAALGEMLVSKPEELAKLDQSQKEWDEGVVTTEESFKTEAEGAGSEGLLATDTAMMNYYKGRVAVLLEQIYELNGNTIDLADYGL